MSERHFRIIMGLWIIIGLYLDVDVVIYALIGLLLFEGITNMRIPLVVTRMRFGKESLSNEKTSTTYKISFEAERALRFIVVLFIGLPYISGMGFLWWMPWFVGFALIGAGLSGICPMVSTLRNIGLR